MVNVNQQGVIPIEGRGYVARRNGNYQTGEYRKLTNCEILEGKIVDRRSCRRSYDPYTYPGPGNPTNISRVLGFHNDSIIYGRNGGQSGFESNPMRATDQDVEATWVLGPLDDAKRIDPLNEEASFELCSYFKYNGKNYWLGSVLSQTLGIPSVSFRLYSQLTTQDDIFVGSFDGFASYTPENTAIDPEGTVVSVSATSPDFMKTWFNNSVVFRDRLWICTPAAVYFSKATDLGKFSVSDGGGFFRFPEANANFMVAIRDTVYVFCEESIYAISYGFDPNSDATVRKISDSMGGLHACVFRDQPYFINYEGVFVIDNNYVKKVSDNDFDLGNNLFTKQELTPFGEYLIVNKAYWYHSYHLRNKPPVGSFYYRTNLFPFPKLDSNAANLMALNANSTLSDEAVIKHEGAGSLKVTSGGTSGQIGFKTSTTNGSRIKVKPKTKYYISYWLYNSHVGTAKSQLIYGECYNAANAAIGQVNSWTLNPSAIVAGQWQMFEGVIETLADTDTISLFGQVSDTVNIPAGNYAIFDEIIMEEGAVSLGPWFSGTNPNVPAEGKFYYSIAATGSEPQKATALSHPFMYHSRKYIEEGRDPFTGVGLNGNTFGFSTFFMNMDNGSTHVVDLRHMTGGTIGLVAFNANQSDSSYPSSYLSLVNCELDGSTVDNSIYHMFYEKDYQFFDQIDPGLPATGRRSPVVDIEIWDISPSGYKYDVKKFRSLEIMSSSHGDFFAVYAGYDNRNLINIGVLEEDLDVNDPSPRPVYPHRFGLNQRARFMALQIYSGLINIADSAVMNPLEIADLRVFWTYTQRRPDRKSWTGTP